MSIKQLQFWTLTTLVIAGIAQAATTTTDPAAAETSAEPFADQALIEKYEDTRGHMRKFGSESAPATHKGSFRLTTYNIENLFDANDDPSLTGRDDDADGTKHRRRHHGL